MQTKAGKLGQHYIICMYVRLYRLFYDLTSISLIVECPISMDILSYTIGVAAVSRRPDS